MYTHVFAVCAYKNSPYLEECIRSLKHQSLPSEIILCTSTPNARIRGIAEKYSLPLYIRNGESDIQDDWNFAYEKAGARLVTLAHQDDRYHRDYSREVQRCWERYPDTTVFMSDCAVMKEGHVVRSGLVALIKHVLRFPLRFHRLADREAIKKSALIFGNPIICPSCTYDKAALGQPLFVSSYKFALDWDTMWRLASWPGRFYCKEKPLICYRIHGDSETKKCIADNRRSEEELAMYMRIWPAFAARVLLFFYRAAYRAYGNLSDGRQQFKSHLNCYDGKRRVRIRK